MAIGFKKISLTIGKKASKDLMPGFQSFSLSQSIGQHHSLRLVFRRDCLEKGDALLKDSLELLGKDVSLNATTLEIDKIRKEETLKFKGIVSSISSGRSTTFSGDLITITAVSPDIILDDGGHSKTFSDKSLNDVVNEVFGDYDLTGEKKINADTTTGTHTYVVQYKESSYAFLNRLASKYGQWFFYDGTAHFFGKLDKSDPIELNYEKNIFNHNVRLETQPFEFSMVAYDYKDDGDQKYESKDKSQSIQLKGLLEKVAKASDDLFTHQSRTLYNHEITKGKQQDHLNHRVLLKKWGKISGMVICSGESDCASLKIGSTIRIIDKKASPDTNYIIVDLNHSASSDGEYTNSFTAIPAECEIPFTANPHSIPLCETQSAIVVDNVDPDNLGRVKVRFFWQEDAETPWLRIVYPYAGNDQDKVPYGIFFKPEINEEVLVGFEGGNAEKPFVIGSLYHAKAFPESWKAENNDIKAIRTRSGHTIEFRDKDGEEEVWIYDYGKEHYSIKLKSHSKEITIQAVENLELKAKNISIVAEEELKMEATDANTNAKGNINTEASGNMVLKSSGDMEVNGSMNTTIKAGAQLEQKGTIVKIN